MFLDILGQEVDVGDLVIFHQAKQFGLCVGRVVTITQEYVQVKYTVDYPATRSVTKIVKPKNVYKLDGEAATVYALKEQI